MGTFLKGQQRKVGLAILFVAALVGCLPGSAANGNPKGSTVVACLQHSEFQYLYQPRTCAFFARQYYPDGTLRRFRDIEGRELRWSDWGAKIAVAVGKWYTAEPMKVVAFDRVECSGGGSSYGKILVLGRPGGGKGAFHLRLARCGAKKFPPLTATGTS